MVGRRSVRAFLPQRISQATVREVLDAASRAPSGVNTQPWQVRVLAGEPLRSLPDFVKWLTTRFRPLNTGQGAPIPQMSGRLLIWTVDVRSVGRFTDCWGLSAGTTFGCTLRNRRNFRLFDAPVGLIFTIDRVLQQGSWLDYGMFLQNVMLAARARGLETCPQAAFAQFHRVTPLHSIYRNAECWSVGWHWVMPILPLSKIRFKLRVRPSISLRLSRGF